MWVDMSGSDDRTTNCYESFHAKCNAEFTSTHSNIFNFMDIFKQIQADTYIKLRNTNIRKKANNQQKICSVIQKKKLPERNT
jgi:hypothetical protein